MQRISAYKKVRNKTPVELIEDICCTIGKEPEDIFSRDSWEEFEWAVKYRNLIVHECTSLRQGYCDSLISACEIIWGRLKRID